MGRTDFAVLRGAEIARAMGAQLPDPALMSYRRALASFDWSFEMSDDGAVWRAGRDALARLHRLQAEVDPNGSLWLQHIDARGLKNVAMPRVGVFA